MYHTVNFDPEANRLLPWDNADPGFATDSDFGYLMVVPGTSYTVAVHTVDRLYFYTEVSLPGSAPFEAGKVYNIILKFLAADEIIIYAKEADEWWYDSTFN